jgi:hypothetical protein
VRAYPSSYFGKLIPGAGDGSFDVPVNGAGTIMVAGSGAARMASGDIDNDGLQELLVVVNNGASLIYFYKQDKAGVWSLASTLAGPSVGFAPLNDLMLVDTKRRGWLDLVVLNPSPNGVQIALNSGSGSFSSWTSIPNSPASPSHVLSADVNNDGSSDLLILTSASSTWHLMLNPNDGAGFPSTGPTAWAAMPVTCTTFFGTDLPRPAAIADFNGCVARLFHAKSSRR